MILNVSRAKAFKLCRRKAFNQYHRKLEGPRSMNLVDGGAFHHGVAVGRATKDWGKAKEAAQEMFDREAATATIPPEQTYLLEEHFNLVTKMIGCFETQYEHEEYQIIQPEVEFDVPLPSSGHNCIFLHWKDSGGSALYVSPSAEDILNHRVFPAHETLDMACSCYQPHRLVGKTDAVVKWNNNIWLDEYKTTSISGQQFWDQWQMDIQPTAYIYGIWKQMGIRPRGFLLNAINKPSEGQVNNWNSKRKYGPPQTIADYIKYEREAFLRTEQDLLRLEQQMVETCQDWEEEITSGIRPDRVPFQLTQMSHTCNSYNRKCDYWSACLSHDQAGEFEGMAERKDDYVDEKLIRIQVS